MTGLFNAGIAGFFAIGAYTSRRILTDIADSPNHVGGFGSARSRSAWSPPCDDGLGRDRLWRRASICLRLRSDYLAIATIGIAEIVRLVLKNETEITNGPRGVSQIPKPFETLPEPYNHLAFLGVVLGMVIVIYVLLEVARKSPWGRVMTAIRENETAVKAAGKNVETYRMEGFVIGCMIMALAGALMAHYLKFVDPNTTDPLTATFLVWVMLIVGGSANNKGAILGAFVMWTVWSATEILTSRLPADLAIRTAYVRIFLIGLALQIFLQRYPAGILPERRPAAAARDGGRPTPPAPT